MKTKILNQQKKHPLNRRKLQQLTDWLGSRLEDRMAPDRWSEVCIVLTDDAGIQETNREYFGRNRPTDVISFRYDPVPGEDPAWSGDLVVNVERAVQVGPDHEGIDRELALYIAHGFNHLSGADDDTESRRRRMRATEIAWLHEAEMLCLGLLQ